MARGKERFEFDFRLGGNSEGQGVVIECVAIFQFGKVRQVTPYFNNCIFDTDGIIIDWEDEFIPMNQKLYVVAQELYDQSKEDDDDTRAFNA